MIKYEFTSRPDFDSKLLPDNFALDLLRTSGWYAPKGALLNIPTNFQPYHIFVIAPAPNRYVTQMIYGYTYEIHYPDPPPVPVDPTAEDPLLDGDELIDEGVIKNGDNIIYTNKRMVMDLNSDGTIDTDPNTTVIMDNNGKSYSTLRIVTNDGQPLVVHSSEDDSDEKIRIDLNNLFVKVNNIVYPLSVLADEIPSEGDDNVPQIIITNRNAAYVRSFVDGTWTQWTSQTGSGSGDIDEEKIYSYIDSRLRFQTSDASMQLSGVMFEMTGVYQEHEENVYPVNASGIEYDSILLFPIHGDSSKLYIAKNENAIYRYDDVEKKYYCVGRDYEELGLIQSGSSTQNE